MIIGITGGSGCGKTTLLKLIAQAGGQVLDCDAIYHQLLKTDEKLLDAIESRFPGTVENGELQRKKLGALVFSDEAALEDLNRITHDAITGEVKRRLKPGLNAIDAIRLLESGLSELCDITVAVTAPEEARIQRLMLRDGISREYAQSRVAAQPDNGWFAANCQRTLCNDGTPEEFQNKCIAFLQECGIMIENNAKRRDYYDQR